MTNGIQNQNSLTTPLLDPEAQHIADEDLAPANHPVAGPAQPGTPFEGMQVEMGPPADAAPPDQARAQGRSRLAGLADAVGGALGILTSPVTLALSAVATAVAYPVAALRDRFSDVLRTAQQQAEALRIQLGEPVADGVWGREIETQNFTTRDENQEPIARPTVAQVMEQYRHDLGSGISHNEMRRYINMGERIVGAIRSLPDEYAGGPITVRGADGEAHEVSPNLETTRAVAWYLQAKAVADNADGARDPVVLQRGSMVLKDPDGRLFKFLKSAPNTYGRASTHFNERSVSDTATLGNTGIAGALAGLRGQKAQYGIEDFANRMPSGLGCLVFDQLRGRDGQPQTYLKWESVGMPTFFGGGTHADRAEGWKAKVKNRFLSQFRCLGHTFNFLQSLRGGARQDWGVHREAVHKDAPKELYAGFEALLTAIRSDEGDGLQAVQSDLRDAKRYGLYHMSNTLVHLSTENPEYANSISALLSQIDEFALGQGDYIGIERKGAEIHVSLEP